jgi:hypothetical protein
MPGLCDLQIGRADASTVAINMQETTAVSEQGGTLAAPIIRSHANDPATGIGASRGRPEQSGGSMPIITIAAGGHVFVEAGGLVSNHRLPFRQPCEAMPSEVSPCTVAKGSFSSACAIHSTGLGASPLVRHCRDICSMKLPPSQRKVYVEPWTPCDGE